MIGDLNFIDGFNNNSRRRHTNILNPFGSLYDWSAELLRFILTLLCGGCNYTATKRISKTASITSISKTQRATRFNVWSNIRLIAIVFLMTQLLSTIGQADAKAMHLRQLKKRHSIINSSVSWENPCGGLYEPNQYHVQAKKASINVLRKAVRGVYLGLDASSEQWINTTDIKMWFVHNQTYKFLPKLRRNSSIALKRWYRNMQTFVGAFSYLHTKHREVDQLKHHQEANITKELRILLENAQTTLCEIEYAINHTTPNNRDRKLTSVTESEMNNRLKFRTKKYLADNPYLVDEIDMKFVKYYFMDFLKTMCDILRHNRNSIYNGSNSLSISDSRSNSRGVSSNETTNVSRRHKGGKKRPTAKKQKPNGSRQRLNKNTSISIA